jgi:hypothetical protein
MQGSDAEVELVEAPAVDLVQELAEGTRWRCSHGQERAGDGPHQEAIAFSASNEFMVTSGASRDGPADLRLWRTFKREEIQAHGFSSQEKPGVIRAAAPDRIPSVVGRRKARGA